MSLSGKPLPPSDFVDKLEEKTHNRIKKGTNTGLLTFVPVEEDARSQAHRSKGAPMGASASEYKGRWEANRGG